MSQRVEENTKEDPQERTAREMIELLQELRIVIPGVQVLFAFLLTVPFNQRFTELNTVQRDVFFATLLCTAAATALLIAPSAHHRLLFRKGLREQRLKMGNLLAILGLVFLVPAMVGVVFVITDLIFGSAVALVVTVAMALLFSLLWFVLPLPYRGNNED
jgi:O-antigen/teichoic acid export membrane protein